MLDEILKLMTLPYEGKLSPKATDEVDCVASTKLPHLIRHGFAVSPSPHRGRLWGHTNKKTPPQKSADQQIRSAPSIYGSCSEATSCKFDTPVSGGAYQDARKVTSEWNARQNIGFRLKSEAERTPRPHALFSPLSFLLREKR